MPTRAEQACSTASNQRSSLDCPALLQLLCLPSSNEIQVVASVEGLNLAESQAEA